MSQNHESAERSGVGDGATAEGLGTRACARGAHAEGLNTVVAGEPEYGKSAEGGHAEGSATRASGWQAHAEGAMSWAEGLIAHAQNCITLAAGNDSHAEGVQTVTGRRRYFILPEDQGMTDCEGHGRRPWFRVRADAALCPDGNVSADFPDRALDPLHGVATADPVAHPETWWRHPTAILFCAKEGPLPLKVRILHAHHDAAHRWTTVFYDGDGEAFGDLPIMLACASYAPEGADTTHSDGKGQHAEGKRTNAAGNFAHAEGRDTTCWGRYSHAEGYRTVVTGQFGAHGEGHRTLAAGPFSHAEGHGVVAAGNGAHAEGCDTVAGGEAAHAAGSQTEALGDHSTAMGQGTRALHAGAVIMGRHGVSTTPYAWHLAGGTSDRPELKARIDAGSGHHVACWTAGGDNYAQWFEWATGGQPADGETASGLFVTLDGDRLRLADSGRDYVLGVVTDRPAFVAGDTGLAPDRCGAGVALVGRVTARDGGDCRPNGFCRPGPGGLAVPAAEGYRVLRRLAADRIELVLK